MRTETRASIEGIAQAEQHGADFGVFVTIRLVHRRPAAETTAALARTLAAWPSLAFRVSGSAGALTPTLLDVDRIESYRHDETLADVTVSALRGDDSFAFHLPADGRTIEILAHHAVVDADSLGAFVTDLDAELGGGAARGDGLATPPADPRAAPSGRTLRAKRRPADGAWAARPLGPALTDRIDATARSMRTTPFALLWSAAVACFSDDTAFATAVSTRRPDAPRGGNATSIAPVTSAVAPSTPIGPNQVRQRFQDLAAAWARVIDAPDTVAAAAPPDVVVSSAAVPHPLGWTAVRDVVLGDYVVKYRHHVQFQRTEREWAIEVYSEGGAASVVAAVTERIEEVVSAAAWGRRPAVAVRTAAQATLDDVLAAPPETRVDDLGIDSLSAVSLIGAVQDRFGVDTTLAHFYAWGSVADVVAHTKRSVSPEPTPAAPPDGLPQPHLTGIFVDAFRLRDSPRYAVEYAFELRDSVVGSLQQLADAADAVLTANAVFGQALEFRDGTVVATDDGEPVRCAIVDADTIGSLRAARPLRVGRPQHLASVRAARIGDTFVLAVTFHHLVVDARAVEVFLDQLGLALRHEPLRAVQYRDVARAVERAKADATATWASWDRGWPPLVGTTGSPSGAHELVSVQLGRIDPSTIVEDGLAATCAALAEVFGVRRGTIGSVHHGRVVAGADRVVGSLARVLPVQFDVDDASMLTRSSALARAVQACTVEELPFPHRGAFPVVVQVLRSDPVPSSVVARRTAFDALTKFGLFVELRIAGATAEVDIAIATDLYPASERLRMASVFRAALDTLSHAESVPA